jgi:hypothetical protein
METAYKLELSDNFSTDDLVYYDFASITLVDADRSFKQCNRNSYAQNYAR